MARKQEEKSATGPDADTTAVPVPEENNSQGKEGDAVKDLPPANPFGEPVKPAEEYPNISEAGKQAAALGIETEETQAVAGDYIAGETTVEHPLSPTDSNPNPHGTRSDDTGGIETVLDDKGVAARQPREDGEVEVTGLWDNPVHLGDSRTLAKGDKAKVSKEVAKDLRDRKAVK